MSRISAVRSMTLALTTPSRRRSWLGVSSPSQITVSAPVAATRAATSAALPAPMYVAASGRPRRWTRPSRITEPAVSASRDSSRSEFSASASVPSVHTPTRMTRSSRSARYSTSVTSSSSVDSPETRRSACRSDRSRAPTPGSRGPAPPRWPASPRGRPSRPGPPGVARWEGVIACSSGSVTRAAVRWFQCCHASGIRSPDTLLWDKHPRRAGCARDVAGNTLTGPQRGVRSTGPAPRGLTSEQHAR